MRFVALFVFFLLFAVSFAPSLTAIRRRVSVNVEIDSAKHHEQEHQVEEPFVPEETNHSEASSLSALSASSDRRRVDESKYRELMTKAANGAKGFPVQDVCPYDGAILPYSRIVCYYGQFESKGLGILGRAGHTEEAISGTMQKLMDATEEWRQADDYPAVPCVDYIASVAQGSPGPNNKWTLRVGDDKIAHAISVAKKYKAITILEIQPGWARMADEAKVLEKWMLDPTVHLAVDPEFELNDGTCDASGAPRHSKADPPGPSGKPRCWAPGKAVGRIHAEEINEIIDWLADLVDRHNLPPKILIIHRFQSQSLVNTHAIKKTAQVQVVLDMDGWGRPSTKKGTWSVAIEHDPVQFAGLKLFSIWDLWLGAKAGEGTPPSRMLTHEEVLKELKPHPLYIQYQ